MGKLRDSIKLVTPRNTVEVKLPDGRVYSGPRGAAIGAFLRVIPEWKDLQIVGAIVNNELRELTYPIDKDACVTPVGMNDTDGSLIYRRSVIFLLEVAFKGLFPQAELSVDYSLASGGLFCRALGRQLLSKDELNALEIKMRELAKADLPFERNTVPLSEAVEYFHVRGQYDKERLLKYRQKDHLVLYSLGDFRDYHHGYMVPSTGYLKWFDLRIMAEGFILRFPRRHAPTQLQPIPESPKLLGEFRQYRKWLARLRIETVGALDDAIRANRIREIILISEALHEQKIAEIAAQIVNRKKLPHIILIAGPSSSGKTTFSKRLAVQLLAQGISPFPLEMDNYFVDRERTPVDEKGQFDYEALEALDIGRMQDNLRRLIAGEEVQLPHYDFKTGKSGPGEVVNLDEGQIIILEGIHGLDPRLLPDISPEQTLRIYCSCLTQLNLDHSNRISTTDTRLLRRIVRDARERGYTAQQTIQRWVSVQRGEKRYIFPYQENADEMFNSALVYELTALKPVVEPLLRQVPFGIREYIEAKRLLAFLEWFLIIDADMIPDNSILREFIGGSILKEFKLWES